MGMMIKHSIKNILAKPVRLIVLMICIVFAGFAGLLALDMSNNVDSLMIGYAMKMIGKMDIMVRDTSSRALKEAEEKYDITVVGISSDVQPLFEKDKSSYAYSTEEQISVIAFSDIRKACELAVLKDVDTLDDTSAVINKKYADRFNAAVGDTISVRTNDKREIKLKVTGIVDITNILISGNSVIVNENVFKQITCVSALSYPIQLIDVQNDKEITAVKELIRKNDPKATVSSLDELIQSDGIDQVYSAFYLLFIISFLLVIFVTMSLAEKTVNERMSVIGTLRSLGIGQGKTAFLLLLENAIYAVTGGIAGCILYRLLKPALVGTLFGSMFMLRNSERVTDYLSETPFYVYLIIIAGALVVECAYPLFELVKAVKTPIRDIIFNNKDTEFKYRWTRLYAGAGLVMVSVVSALLTRNFITMSVSLITGIFALALLIPFLIRICSRALSMMFRKMRMPIAQLAAENVSRNKIIIGTAVLCITSIVLSLLIGGVGESLTSHLVTPDYSCDLIVDIFLSDVNHQYRFIGNIDGVSETDYVYGDSIGTSINGSKQEVYSVWADVPHSLFADLPKEGFDLKDGEIVMTEPKAKHLGIKPGDEVTVAFNADTDFPNIMNFVLKDTVPVGNDTALLSSDTIIISKTLYDHLFDGSLTNILLKTDRPDEVKAFINDNVENGNVDVNTYEELKQNSVERSEGLLTVLRLVIAFSVLLTLIGVAGNQSLGFVTRKREIALLHSVAMPRKKLCRLLFLESLFSMGISAFFAIIAAPFLFNVLGHLFALFSDGDISILEKGSVDTSMMFAYLLIMLSIYLLTTLSPVKQLRKMNMSEELKYE